MEGLKSTVGDVESIENPAAWRELKEQAPKQAQILISERAENFADMSAAERIEILNSLLSECDADEFSGEQVDNSLRFVAEELAQRLTLEKAQLEVENILNRYSGLAA